MTESREKERRILELEAELRTVRARTDQADEPSWLVKDFHILYQTAFRFSEACHGRGDGRPYGPQRDLDAQLERLRPAFELCEAARAGWRMVVPGVVAGPGVTVTKKPGEGQ